MSTLIDKANISMWSSIEKAINDFIIESRKNIDKGEELRKKAETMSNYGYIEYRSEGSDLIHRGNASIEAANHTMAYWKSHFGIPSTETMDSDILKYTYKHKYHAYLKLQSIIEEIIKSEGMI